MRSYIAPTLLKWVTRDFVFADEELVESNRKLIEVFEAKIKAKLDEIWGAA